MHWSGCSFILTKDVGVISCATGSTCQAPNDSAEQQGDAPHSYWPSVSNEQWDVESQCRAFPDRRSNHYFTLRFDIISNHVLVLLLPQEGHAHRLGTSWHVWPHDRPCSPADRWVTSFLLYFLQIGLLHGMHIVLGWEFNWLYMWWTVL